jgi:hypothetical protein
MKPLTFPGCDQYFRGKIGGQKYPVCRLGKSHKGKGNKKKREPLWCNYKADDFSLNSRMNRFILLSHSENKSIKSFVIGLLVEGSIK